MGKATKEQVKRRYQDGTYRNGGDGFISWCEDNVMASVYPVGKAIPRWVSMGELPDERYPDTERSYREAWEHQKTVLREALEMQDGLFTHNLIILCWMRGEGKSFFVALILLWKFMCFPEQRIIISGNSKDQTKFSIYDIVRTTIENSPRISNIIGLDHIQAREIRLVDGNGNVRSTIQVASKFTGILSNATGFCFTEFFQLKNSDFFEEIYGSIRNVPNALGIIDSTVSAREHKLYQLYQGVEKGLMQLCYFSYRSSQGGDYRDFWHPKMNQKQLDSYQASMLPQAYDRFFRNLWSAGSDQLFPEDLIEAVRYFGANGRMDHGELMETLKARRELMDRVQGMNREGLDEATHHIMVRNTHIKNIEKSLWPVSSVYRLSEDGVRPFHATLEDLERLCLTRNSPCWPGLTGGTP